MHTVALATSRYETERDKRAGCSLPAPLSAGDVSENPRTLLRVTFLASSDAA
jgi:hypothetical protein